MSSLLLPPDYRYLSRLGGGGFGEVLEVERLSTGQVLAMKVMREIADPKAKERFAREARTAASLRHPHLAPVLDVGTLPGGEPFLVLPRYQGLSLRQTLESGPLSFSRWVQLGVELSQALFEVHRCGIVHRDVKPENVMFRESGESVLLDFGLARGLEGWTPMTAEGILLGTPSYMAFELFQGEPASASSDQWALAALLVEAGSGEKLIPWEDLAVLSRRMGRGELPRWFPEGHSPSALQRVLSRALSRRPSERFSDLFEFHQLWQEAAKQDSRDPSQVAWISDFNSSDPEEARIETRRLPLEEKGGQALPSKPLDSPPSPPIRFGPFGRGALGMGLGCLAFFLFPALFPGWIPGSKPPLPPSPSSSPPKDPKPGIPRVQELDAARARLFASARFFFPGREVLPPVEEMVSGHPLKERQLWLREVDDVRLLEAWTTHRKAFREWLRDLRGGQARRSEPFEPGLRELFLQHGLGIFSTSLHAEILAAIEARQGVGVFPLERAKQMVVELSNLGPKLARFEDPGAQLLGRTLKDLEILAFTRDPQGPQADPIEASYQGWTEILPSMTTPKLRKLWSLYSARSLFVLAMTQTSLDFCSSSWNRLAHLQQGAWSSNPEQNLEVAAVASSFLFWAQSQADCISRRDLDRGVRETRRLQEQGANRMREALAWMRRLPDPLLPRGLDYLANLGLIVHSPEMTIYPRQDLMSGVRKDLRKVRRHLEGRLAKVDGGGR